MFSVVWFGADVVYLFLNYSLLGFVWTLPFVLLKVPGLPENLSYWCLITSLLFHLSPRVSVFNHFFPSSEIGNVSISSKKVWVLGGSMHLQRADLYAMNIRRRVSFNNAIFLFHEQLQKVRWVGNLAQKTSPKTYAVVYYFQCVQFKFNQMETILVL